MDDLTKQRAVGGVVLVALAIIFVPMFVDFGGSEQIDAMVAVPPKPQGEMRTAEIPLSPLGEKSAAELVPANGPTPEQLIAEAADVGDVSNRDTPPDMEALPPPEAPATASKSAAVAATVKAAAPAVAKAEPKMPAPKPQLAPAATGGAKAWAVQVGSFTKKENAQKVVDRLRKSGYKAFLAKQSSGGKTIVRVRIGPELQRADADLLRKKIEKEMQLQARVVEHP